MTDPAPPPPTWGWTPPNPPDPDAAQRRQRRLLFIGIPVGIILLLAAIGSLAPQEDDTTAKPVATQPQQSRSAAPPPKPDTPAVALDKALKRELGGSNRKVTRYAVAGPVGAGLPIKLTVAFNENLTEGLTKDTARRDTLEALEAVRKTAAWAYTEVEITGTYSMADQYGNASETLVFKGVYPKKVVDRINFGGVDFKVTFDLADPMVLLHPAFRY